MPARRFLTSDLLGFRATVLSSGATDLTIAGLNEEHGTLRAAKGQTTGLRVGDRLRIIPVTAAFVSNMVDTVTLVDAAGWREGSGRGARTGVLSRAFGCLTLFRRG